jgi:hypothetical protein
MLTDHGFSCEKMAILRIDFICSKCDWTVAALIMMIFEPITVRQL